MIVIVILLLFPNALSAFNIGLHRSRLVLHPRKRSALLLVEVNSYESLGRRRIILRMGLRGKRRRAELRQLKQQETPAFLKTPYGKIRPQSKPRLCTTCIGRGKVRCPVCEGKGLLPATGHAQKFNRIHQPILGSRWTSVLIREGHRQYTVSETRGSPKKGNKKDMQFRMSNCCGPEEERVHIWITLQELRDKNVWRAGWTSLQDIIMADHGTLLDIKECFRCKGERVCECIECGGVGKVGLQQILFD